MTKRDIIVIGGSAGGGEAMIVLARDLPADIEAAICVVIHFLAIISKSGGISGKICRTWDAQPALKVKQAEEGDLLRPGTVYIARPDRHLLANTDNTLSLTQSELVHFVRPSADMLSESVAASHKDRAIAVVLTGTGSDGAMGVQAIKKMGGTVIVQDKATAEFDGMPLAAIQTGCADFILPLEEIAGALVTLIMTEDRD